MRWWSCVSIALTICTATFGGAAQNPVEVLQQACPGAIVGVNETGWVTNLSGVAMSAGLSAEESAELFVLGHAAAFGAQVSDMAKGNAFDGAETLPVMFEPETGAYKFTLVYYRQERDGLTVFRSNMDLLARNVDSFPLVWVGANLRPLGDFRVPHSISVNDAAAREAVQAQYPGMVNFSDPQMTIFAGVEEQVVTPTVAIVFVADNGLEATPAERKRLFVCDAQTGAILFDEDQIVHVDIQGQVRGNATRGYKADECDVEQSYGLPYAEVSVQGGNSAFADKDGFFTIPHGGADPVNVDSRVRGKYFNTSDSSGGQNLLTKQVTPPGPVDFFHNEANTEYYRSAVNSYLHANIARDLILKYHPTYPTISTQTGFTVNVNIASSCNAYYNGSSINFYRKQGSCNNTGFGTVVHHEYGHHLVAKGGSDQGQYGEGMADTLGILISDDKGLAYGFYAGQCNTALRDPTLTPQRYPCTGAIHTCGMLLSGCVWQTRERLVPNFPNTYRDVLGRLGINAVVLHRGQTIDPNITTHYLTLDDDDQNLANGTPHSLEICGGFGHGQHNMVQGTACMTMKHIRIADANCDGKRDFGDINPFVLAMSDLNAYKQQYPNCYTENSDCNKDGSIDFGDIEKFVEAITTNW